MFCIVLILALYCIPAFGDINSAESDEVSLNQGIYKICKVTEAKVLRVDLEPLSKLEKMPRYGVRSTKCLKGKCPTLKKGNNLEEFGIKITHAEYFAEGGLYLAWAGKQFLWSYLIWANDSAIAKNCKASH